MSERKHTDLWRELVDEAGEEEIDRAANVTVAEAELRAAGFDVAAERAKAGAFLDALGRAGSTSTSEQAPPRPVEAPRRKRPRPAVLWLAAAATFAVAGGAVYATLHRSPEPVAKGHPPEPSTPAPVVPSADDLGDGLALMIPRHSDVARLEIAMNDAGLVGGGDSPEGRQDAVGDRGDGHRSVPPAVGSQIFARDE